MRRWERTSAPKELTVKVCPWGWCTVCEAEDCSFGPMMCPCDNLPGWRATRVAEMSMPRVPVKARGRHGSRVARSRKRHVLPDWPKSLDMEWLPARSAYKEEVE